MLTLICSKGKKLISLTVNWTFRRYVLSARLCRVLEFSRHGELQNVNWRSCFFLCKLKLSWLAFYNFLDFFCCFVYFFCQNEVKPFKDDPLFCGIDFSSDSNWQFCGANNLNYMSTVIIISIINTEKYYKFFIKKTSSNGTLVYVQRQSASMCSTFQLKL